MKACRDHKGRQFGSYKKLCEENGFKYSSFRSVMKKLNCGSEEASEYLAGRAGAGAFHKTDKDDCCFVPKTPYPSVEYIRFLRMKIKWLLTEIPELKGYDAINANRMVIGYKEQLKILEGEGFWLSLYDNLSCGEDSLVAGRAMKDRALQQLDNPSGLIELIYEDFSKKFHLGKYRS